MSFTIVTDTSANIPTPMVKKYGMEVIPLSYHMEGEDRTCLDTETFDSAAYYAKMKEGVKITTSQINPQLYVDRLEPLLQEGQDVLYLGMSAGISGTFQSAQIAKTQLEEQYPGRTVRVVDTMGASLGEGLQVLKAQRCKEQGMSLEETACMIENTRMQMCQIFTVDDLGHLRRGGRLSNAAAILGTLLHIKPVLKGNEKGKIVSTEKVRGRKGVLTRLAQKYDALAVKPENQVVGISYCDCREDADFLADLIKRNHPPKEIMMVEHEPVTGSYLGPGALALYFEGAEDVRTK